MIETFSGALDRSVVAAETAENVGSVKEFVVDAGAQRIDHLQIAGHRKNARFLAWSSVRSFGPDAVVAEAESPGMIDVVPHNESKLIGSRILTTAGFVIGKVIDVQFETTDGSIVSVSTDNGPIEALRLRSIGSYALIVTP